MSFTFAATGGGTRMLSELRPGSRVRILAPLGRGYETAPGRWLLVGGGMGTAGFPFLLDRLDSALVLAGASTAGRLVCLPPGAVVATEDGSAGRRGLVTGLLEGVDWRCFAGIAACGPAPMLAAVAEMCPVDHRGRLQVSMEAWMACGWGVCGGCAVPAAGGGYLQCCTDGPVFGADRLDWGRM
jgi:dihydroorotate dehydrogenase electron transfer subunit